MSETNLELLHDVMKLSPGERAEFVDAIMTSLDQPDPTIDALWKSEAQSRIAAYEQGEIETVSLHDVLSKYGMS